MVHLYFTIFEFSQEKSHDSKYDLKNISLLDRIWWLVRFNHFILWLNRLIFSVSINSHPDSICMFGLLNIENRVEQQDSVMYTQSTITKVHIIYKKIDKN
jgi:hypothetical protein